MNKKDPTYFTQVLSAFIVGFLAAVFAYIIRTYTEHSEAYVFDEIYEHHNYYLLLLPVAGLMLIWLFSKYVFGNKPNGGIAEILIGIREKKSTIEISKIFSHLINGYITVTSGGSTGIEVSTVVSSASIGSNVLKETEARKELRNSLIIAGAGAGVTALFNSPLGGILFALEVLLIQMDLRSIILIIISSLTALAFNYAIDVEPFFKSDVITWHYYAVPFFVLLAIFGALLSVYLTRSVITIKSLLLNKLRHPSYRIVTGGLLISACIALLPALFGEGYKTIEHIIDQGDIVNPKFLLSVNMGIVCILILILKPLITALTLATGGDGGVFAPSLFLGAVAGFVLAKIINMTGIVAVQELNFVIIGMAVVLSASIHAPLTAIFLVCSLTGSYTLLMPLFLASFIAMLIAKKIFPYTVYSYALVKREK